MPAAHYRAVSPQGAVKRQALYACSTCTPPGAEPAGICLACSYECHGSHRLLELYTKRYRPGAAGVVLSCGGFFPFRDLRGADKRRGG